MANRGIKLPGFIHSWIETRRDNEYLRERFRLVLGNPVAAMLQQRPSEPRDSLYELFAALAKIPEPASKREKEAIVRRAVKIFRDAERKTQALAGPLTREVNGLLGHQERLPDFLRDTANTFRQGTKMRSNNTPQLTEQS